MTPPSDPAQTLDDEPIAVEEASNDRLLYLSDGVFAVVITLLVLELKVPRPTATVGTDTTLLQVLRGFVPLLPSLFGYVLSFVTVGIMWANHCVLFRYIKKNDHFLTVINTLVLLVVAFVPFVTAVLAAYLPLPAPYPQAAALIYCGSNLLMAVSFNVLWRHASRDNRLLDPSLDPRLLERVHQRYRFGPHIYAGCFLLGFVSVWLALAVAALLALLFALPYGDEARAIEERLSRFKGRRSP